MTSNYGYGYDQSNYGYQYVMTPGSAVVQPSVGYGSDTQTYAYYHQQTTQGNNPQAYNAYSYTTTPTTGPSTSGYPSYYEYSYQAQSTAVATTYSTIAYPQTGSYSSAYPHSSTTSYYQSTTGIGNQGYGGSALTPQQQAVVQQYATQKKNFMKKKLYEPQQEYYCESCKVACGSRLTYKTHLEGKNHKKRLQQLAKIEKVTSDQMKCDICEITCSNKDSYLAHIKGNKHLKTINLFRKLGKPLPSMTTMVPTVDGSIQVTGPRISFVGGSKLSSTGLMLHEKEDIKVYPPGAPLPKEVVGVAKGEMTVNQESAPNDEPVGEFLVVSIKGDPRSPLSSYHCQLCDCFFNDELAKRMHCKGRRHKLNYKKKYQPDLKVDLPKSQMKAIEKRRQKWIDKKKNIAAGNKRGGGDNQRPQEHPTNKMHGGYNSYYVDYDMSWGPSPHWNEQMLFNPADDILIENKHEQLILTEIEYSQKVVQDIEKCLKLISDDFLATKCRQLTQANPFSIKNEDMAKDESLREIKGVMRVGLFAKNLLIRDKLEIELVLMCADKPTRSLLQDITDTLPNKLDLCVQPNQTYHVTSDPNKAGLMIISSISGTVVTVTVTLTSSTMRDDAAQDQEGQDVLLIDKQSCVKGLASLRQAKWYQAMCEGLPSFHITMRLLMDLCHRNHIWSVLSVWLLELLVQKCIVGGSPGYDRPGDVFRRVIECISSGVFLPGYPGLLDPCENGQVDVASSLTAQQRADITLSAQHYLRLIAFNQLNLVLDIKPPENYAPYSLGRRVQQWTTVDEIEDVDDDENDDSDIKGSKLQAM